MMPMMMSATQKVAIRSILFMSLPYHAFFHFCMVLYACLAILEGMNTSDPAQLPKNEDEWKHTLSPEQYKVLREAGTEAAFTGKYVYSEDDGMFRCAACGNALFSSDNKFDSATGWPSFDRPASKDSIVTEVDATLSMRRIEVLCKKCRSHLGHVFDDGPTDTGKRNCINSVCLDLQVKI